MGFSTKFIGYDKKEADDFIKKVRKGYEYEDHQLNIAMYRLSNKVDSLEQRKAELKKTYEERVFRVNACRNAIADEFVSSIQSVHSTVKETEDKRAELQNQLKIRKEELEKVEELMDKLSHQLSDLSSCFDNRMEDINGNY